MGAFEAKTHLSRLLDRVEQGETITITRHGKPVARLMPTASPGRQELRQVIEQLRELRKQQRLGGIAIRELIDQGRR